MTTTKAAHTPGPWKIGSGRRHVYYVNDAIEAGDETIDDPRHDSVIARCEVGVYSGIPDDEIEANVRLIAKAPELAAVLADLFEHCAMVHKHWGEGDNTKQANEAIERGRALLAEISDPG